MSPIFLKAGRSRVSGSRGGHAVVIGGSMAGLLAGRVLADHFERVTIVERDHFPLEPVARKGVPQAQHVHVLLTRGQRILGQLFPGLAEDMIAAGVPFVDAAQDIAWLTPEGWAVRFRSGLNLWSASRTLLEYVVRRRVAGLPGVSFLEDTDITGLLPRTDGTAVGGVAIRRRRPVPDDHLGNCLEADLVVDASGRGSRAPQWLKALGYTPPEDTVVNAFLGYASRVYQSPPNPPAEWKTLYLQSKPPVGKRTGLIAPVEGGRWMVTLSGRGGDYPPTDEAGFLDFARSLPSSMLYEAIRQAEPLSPIAGYRATENRLRHFERLARWPEGFVVLGDAACAFNPVYGQGMTTAALGAVTLDQCLRSQPAGPARVHDGLARRFQRQLAAVNVTPWLLATGEDHRYPTTVGGRPSRLTRLQQHYVDQVIRLSTRDPQTRLTFLKVLHLIQSPRALFGPRVLLGLLRQAFSFAESEQRSVSSPVHAERRGVSSPVQIVPVQPAPAGSCRAARPGLGNVL